MRLLSKFWTSPRRFKWLLMEAYVRLGTASLRRFLRLPWRVQYLMRQHPVMRQPLITSPTCQEVCRAVELAARVVPGTTCLMKARVGCTMLNRLGYEAEVKIGVSRNLSGIEAHAWVKCDGAIVMGDSQNPYAELQKIEHPA